MANSIGEAIFFRQFQLSARIGVLPHEKQRQQAIVINLEFAIDAQKAAVTDAIEDTVNYVEIKQEIQRLVELQHYHLLETLATRLADQLVAKFHLAELVLSISKPEIFRDMEAVGVRVVRFNR